MFAAALQVRLDNVKWLFAFRGESAMQAQNYDYKPI
jgi:hypothetical protein